MKNNHMNTQMSPPTHPTAPGYTPGPWTASDTGVLANELNEHGNFYLVGTPFPNEEMTDRDRANLRLIALAPEMAEALSAMYCAGFWTADELPNLPDHQRKAIAAARAALTAATPSGAQKKPRQTEGDKLQEWIARNPDVNEAI